MDNTIYLNNSKQLLMLTLAKIDGAYAPTTIRAYREDFIDFIKYSESIDRCALPADSQTISGFIEHLIKRNKKSASIRRAIAGISSIHSLSGERDPTKETDVRLALRRMHRQLGRYSHQALGLTKQKLEEMLTVTDDSLRGYRDRALLMTAYDTLCRRSELLSLHAEDIDEQLINNTRTMVILLRRSKTDQDAQGKWLAISQNTAEAIIDWLNKSNIDPTPIFRAI